eukprot:6466233-Amphidinium_carterae.1
MGDHDRHTRQHSATIGRTSYSGPVWDRALLKESFKSTTGITPNMLEWIVESAIEEAISHPQPDNLVNLMDNPSGTNQHDVQLSYRTVHFWFEKNKMVTSLSYNAEDDRYNGEQVKRISELKRRELRCLRRMATIPTKSSRT